MLAILALMLPASAFPSFADNDTGVAYCVIWSYGTPAPGGYYISERYYKKGEIPEVPDITPTKTDEHRLFHFIGWDREPEPIQKDTVYYAMYQVYEKKYAMNDDTQITIADVTHLLAYLSDESSTKIFTDPDIDGDKAAGIKDVTFLLSYLSKGDPPVISSEKLIEEWYEKYG